MVRKHLLILTSRLEFLEVRYADIFKSYLGMLARERISILTPTFDHVTKVDQDMIWQDLSVTSINVINLIV